VFHRFKLLGQKTLVAPVYAKPPPGRTTFVGFVLDIDGSTDSAQMNETDETLSDVYKTRFPNGVVKVSWRDTKEAGHEKEMYAAAHGETTWNPGLARHGLSERLSDYGVEKFDLDLKVPGAGSPSPDPEAHPPTLYPEVITLRSFGEPLSQCKTPRELFEVIYDACLSTCLFHCIIRADDSPSIGGYVCRRRTSPRRVGKEYHVSSSAQDSDW